MSKIVITGANRGIGLELTRIAAADHEVVALVRKSSPELDALAAEGSVTVREGVDVTDDVGVAELANELEGVDVLINNAGILRRESLRALDFDSIRAQLEVNALAPLRLTASLAPRINRGGKVAFITSRMGSIADNTSGGAYGYRMSKAALNMAATSLAHDLAGEGVAVAILHPGYVRTDMTGHSGHLEPAESAALLWERIEALTPETSGTFWHANGEVLPW